jgi:hypothetical protein
VRLGGEKTLEVSKPPEEECQKQASEEVPCEKALGRSSADFVGASEDGSRVFFTTQAPLTGGADTTTNLFMATVGCPSGEGETCVSSGETESTKITSVVQVSADPNPVGQAAVQGILRVAPNGSRAYFVASGDLLSQPEQQLLESEGRPVPMVGADNLYAYGGVSTAKSVFVADLCSGGGLSEGSSGVVEDPNCPRDLEATGVRSDTRLWLRPDAEAQTGGADGRFLVFSTYGRLVAADTDTAKDVYRYDAESESLQRVSVGEAGHGANGNCNDAGSETTCDATIHAAHFGGSVSSQYELDSRAVSEDGSRIVFTTAQPLSGDASNGLQNAYEWHGEPAGGEGRVSLISTGSASEPVTDVVISPSGNDVFFVTNQGLVPQDTDGANDIYDARLGGGFAQAQAPAAPCEGDACQGPLTNPAPLLVPGSVSQSPGENLMAPVTPAGKPTPKAKPKHCPKAKKQSHRKCVKQKQKEKANKANHRRMGR